VGCRLRIGQISLLGKIAGRVSGAGTKLGIGENEERPFLQNERSETGPAENEGRFLQAMNW
jgi:hypothetical protein